LNLKRIIRKQTLPVVIPPLFNFSGHAVEKSLVFLEKSGDKIKKVVFLTHYNILKYVHIFSNMS